MAKKQCIKERIERSVERIPECGCWIWTLRSSSDGYGQIAIDSRPKRAHRVAWETYRGAIPEGMHVLHRCDVPLCVNPAHLFLGTGQDNMDDMTRKRRRIGALAGTKNGNARLTESQVLEIFAMRSSGVRVKDIAKLVNMRPHHITDILHRRIWRHVKMEQPL